MSLLVRYLFVWVGGRWGRGPQSIPAMGCINPVCGLCVKDTFQSPTPSLEWSLWEGPGICV